MCKERQSGTEEWTNEQWCDMERDSPYFYACLCPFGGKVFVFVFFFSLSLSKDCHCNVVGKTGWRCFLVVDVEPGSNVKTLLSGVVVEVFSRTSGTDVVLQDKYALKSASSLVRRSTVTPGVEESIYANLGLLNQWSPCAFLFVVYIVGVIAYCTFGLQDDLKSFIDIILL